MSVAWSPTGFTNHRTFGHQLLPSIFSNGEIREFLTGFPHDVEERTPRSKRQLCRLVTHLGPPLRACITGQFFREFIRSHDDTCFVAIVSYPHSEHITQ